MKSPIVAAVLSGIALLPAVAVAQSAEPMSGLVARHQAMLDLATDGVVLNVAAHPDDESSRTNTMLRRKHGLRVVTAYTTYGDGGQNAIGREIGPALARLRVRETMRAAAMGDVEVRWLGMPDFGFSKTLEETLGVWGEEELLARMRALVDEVQPDIVITNHSLDRGHGHHRASFWAIERVLRERAENGDKVTPLYRRCSVDDAQWTMDPSELDPARGETYAELAHRAWTQHVTQGPWGAHDPLRVGKDWWLCAWPADLPPQRAAAWQEWLPGRAAAEQFAAGIDWRTGDEWPTEVRRLLALARREFLTLGGDDAARRRAAVLRHRMAVCVRALLVAANIRPEVWLERDTVPQGGRGKVFVVVHGVERATDVVVLCDGEPAGPVEVPMRVTPFDGLPAAPAGGEGGAAAAEGSSGDGAAANGGAQPAVRQPVSTARPGRFVGEFACAFGRGDELSESPELQFAEVGVSLHLDGEPLLWRTQVAYTPVPRIEVQWDRDVVIVARGSASDRLLTAHVTSNIETPAEAAVRLSMGPGIQAVSTPGRLRLAPEHAQARLLVRTAIIAADRTPDSGLEVGFRDSGARLRVVEVDAQVPEGMHIALVRGPDDSTEMALADLGIDYVTLDPDALLMARFEDYSAVLLDIRAYHHRPELAEVRDRLLSYCRGGGRIVSMYHKPNEWNEHGGHPLLAPFALVVGNDRVTEEDAAVAFLQPEHRLLTYPHRLDTGDFAGWVQERGLNFPTRWDPAWSPLLSMKDRSDEKASEGGLLHTSYGRGDFVYCSLALYRQLRVGHAGAARLLVNLLAR